MSGAGLGTAVGGAGPLGASTADSPLAPLLFALLVAGISLWALFAAFRALKRARVVEDVPTSRLRSAAQGYVELSGTAELLPGTPVLSPLSGRACAWYRYRVDVRERDSRSGSREWRMVENGVSDALFRLVDETGECVVDPDGADVTPALNQTWYGIERVPGGPPPRESALSLFSGRYRYREELIRPGDPLHAVGNLRTVGGPADQTPVHEDVRALLAEWKRDRARMRTFDADGDGAVGPAEWETVRKAAVTEVLRRRADRSAHLGTHVLSAPPTPGRPFLLSAVHQDTLARRYRWRAAALLVLSLGAAALAVWVSQQTWVG
ncbi:MAG: hypothetical protein KA217_10195 [Gammaproteobacteria bacterium]|nr:hypothetical protein [Gammaproteobacteria bacterium]